MESAGPREARAPNWLPIPGERHVVVEEVPEVDENDLFPKGRVLSFFPRQHIGTLQSDRGEIFPFALAELDLVGPKGHARYLSAGARIGYDLSCTSHGRRISRMKVY